MRHYCAPMEGVTGWIYRGTHHRYFPGVDKYFMPFFSPNQDHVFPRRALQDLRPEHNGGLNAVPQLLTRRAGDFIWAAGELARMGYGEVNLNLGCPSGTVAAKGKGAGFLARPEELDRFLDEIFSAGLPIRISIKTRLGVEDPAEFPRLLELFNRYPVAELTVHPRVRKDFYRHPVRMEGFAAAHETAKPPLCYNGDLVSAADCAGLAGRFPRVEALMLGRGLVADPALVSRLRGGPGADRARLESFHRELYEDYCAAFGSRRNAMLRMKEVWFYHIHLFRGGAGYGKKLRKTADFREYEALAASIYRDLELLEEPAVEGGW